MIIFPAIDLSEGQVVRLLYGDYDQKTVYSSDPVSVAKGFAEAGAEWMHVVDLDGAKCGYAANAAVIEKIVAQCGLKVEIGGGIRNIETVDKYVSCGAERIILGTAALRDRAFLLSAVEKYGEKIAVGVDIKNGNVAVNGWMEDDGVGYCEFLDELERIGVKTVIVTDISKDGAMQGTNRALYRALKEKYSLDIIASGGVSSIDDVSALCEMEVYGAIIGRALYNGGIDLKHAVELARESTK